VRSVRHDPFLARPSHSPWFVDRDFARTDAVFGSPNGPVRAGSGAGPPVSWFVNAAGVHAGSAEQFWRSDHRKRSVPGFGLNLPAGETGLTDRRRR